MSYIHPRVSIGLPVYNGEQYLSAAFESLLAQTFQDFEIIICDNASTDGTEAICRSFASRDRRIRYCCNPHNVGASANFNRTFELASGEYFKWAAHDDLCAPEFLARCVEVLDRDVSAVLAYPKAMIIDADSCELGPYTRKLHTDSPSPAVRFKELLKGHKCFEIFGLIRRDALAKTPLIGGYANGDGVLLVRLAFLGRFEEIPEYLFFPRRHSDQSMSMLGNYRRYAAWFNPKLGTKMLFPFWRRHFEYLRSIHMASLSLSQRIRCYRVLARRTYARRQLLRAEIAFHVRRLAQAYLFNAIRLVCGPKS